MNYTELFTVLIVCCSFTVSLPNGFLKIFADCAVVIQQQTIYLPNYNTLILYFESYSLSFIQYLPINNIVDASTSWCYNIGLDVKNYNPDIFFNFKDF